jgi:hypothetical protein
MSNHSKNKGETEMAVYEAIVTLVYPVTQRLVPGTGALLSRDYMEEDAPAHTEVYRLEFDTERHMLDWLNANGDAARIAFGHM